MRKILICFAYKGTNYSGYQKQPNKVTVQSALEDCLNNVLKEKVSITASGRTDAGVHALKQYAHFECENKISLDKNDDYHTMQEVIYRRYYRALVDKTELPDLIIVDGGITVK